MIEIPESRTLAQQIRETFAGKTVMNVYANSSPHKFTWFSGDPETYHERLCGKQVTGARAVGGMVQMELEDIRLVFADGVNPRYIDAGEKIPHKHQLHVEFEDFSSLTCSVQMYGGIWLLEKGEQGGEYYCLAKQKINPLEDMFDWDYFFGLFTETKPNQSVKAFLATHQRIPGLGNGVLQDILFYAAVHPKRKLETLSDGELRRIFDSVKKTLSAMTARGGRNTEKDLFGCMGGYRTVLSAKTKEEPCPVCGSVIVREAFLGGNVYYCPECQKIEK